MARESQSYFTKNSIISMVGNLSTAYNLTIISLAFTMSEYVYPEDKSTSTITSSNVKTAALIGAIVGQLTFGYVGDCLGRSKAMGLTMALTVAGAILSAINQPFGVDTYGPDITEGQLACAAHYDANNTKAYTDCTNNLGSDKTHSEYGWLIFTRLLLGIGVGGVYPLAATIAAESSGSAANRGKQVSLVFSTQGIGFLLCPLIVMFLCKVNKESTINFANASSGAPTSAPNGCFKYYTVAKGADSMSQLFGPYGDDLGNSSHTTSCSNGANDLNWRLALLIGALPGLLLIPFKVSETSNVVKDPTRKSTFWSDLGRREYWPKLLGTAGGWFLFDIVFYGNSLFAPIVTKAIWSEDADMATTASHNAIVFCIALPGYWVATILMDKLGRKNIQILGFSMMTIIFAILAYLLDNKEKPKMTAHHSAALLFLYGLTFFFANFGPNSTTFILPSETYPQEVRSSLNGFSAACGKLGAAVGSYGFKPLSVAYGIPVVLAICSVVSILGVLCTLFFVEDRRGKNMAENSSRIYSNIQDSHEGTSLLSSPVAEK
jgi:PHS family inorganic phosphate transporter-like MFS transporter